MSHSSTELQALDTTIDKINRLRHVIETKVGSKKQWAKLLNVAPTTVSAWTSGRIFPSVLVLIKIAAISKTSLDWLLLGKINSELNIDEQIFNQVFQAGYQLALQHKLTLTGSYFLGLYEYVTQELKTQPGSSPLEIIKNNQAMLIRLRK